MEDFRKINAVLMEVIKAALAYLISHDGRPKNHCLQESAWDGIEKLEKVSDSLSEPFRSPVSICLNECTNARMKMPTTSIDKDEFPVAAESLIALSGQIDQIRESDSSIAEGIDKDHLASEPMFTSLARLASLI